MRWRARCISLPPLTTVSGPACRRYGRIGKAVVGYARAFGMKVWVWGGEGSRQRAAADGIEVAGSREAFFSESDAVTLHVRLLPATRGVITAEDLALMPPHSILVNTSRAGLLQEGALLAALRAGRPGMAAVDVLDKVRGSSSSKGLDA